MGLRVLHIASGDLWGGAEALVHSLAAEQNRGGPIQASCVVTNPGRLADELMRTGVPVTVLDESRQGIVELARVVSRERRRLRADVLHSHRQKEHFIASLASFGSDAPALVATIHGMPEPARVANQARRRIIKAVNDAVLRRRFDAVVAVSEDMVNLLRPQFPGVPLSCIHNGVRVEGSFGSIPWSPDPEGRLRLLALGRLVPIKRFDRLSGIATALATQMGRIPKITLAGDGPLNGELRHQLRLEEPGSGIQMPGFVSDTSALMDQSDALLITSDHEGIPMAALEALSKGLPVFGFAVGGLPEIAAAGGAIRLVEPGDCTALVREIVTYFALIPPGQRILPPPDWPFDIRQCAMAYQRLYEAL